MFENIQKKGIEKKEGEEKQKGKRTERISVQEITQINLFSLPLLFYSFLDRDYF